MGLARKKESKKEHAKIHKFHTFGVNEASLF